MSASGPLDPQTPWLAPYAHWATRLLSALGQGACAKQALAGMESPIDLAAGPLRFVAPQDAPAGEAYESFIARTACVPTRDNLHDLFNGLVWLALPRIKRRLNSLQAQEIARLGVGAARGPLRDALTLLDENGALFDAPPVLWDALVQRDWQALFVTHRARWSAARLLVFGHALLEKLATMPRKALTAHVLMRPPGIEAGTDFDAEAFAAAITGPWLAGKPFAPLPVLGIPGWCGENQNFSFYDDSQVFRPAGRQKQQQLPRPCISIQLEAGRSVPN